jgi:hypothetical protein
MLRVRLGGDKVRSHDIEDIKSFDCGDGFGVVARFVILVASGDFGVTSREGDKFTVAELVHTRDAMAAGGAEG